MRGALRRAAAPRRRAVRHSSDAVRAQLSKIIDPDLKRDIVSLEFVKNLNVDVGAGHVDFDLQLTTPACPVKDQFKQGCEDVLRELEWVRTVDVRLTARPRPPSRPSEGLKGVNFILAVASCKGGVGKSSVAVNLAYALAGLGAKVGVLDADVYGPSLPTLVPVDSRVYAERGTKLLRPLEHNGVKLMSMGYIRPGEFQALRGPMVSGMVQQMLGGVAWGELDYLVIDMPPGTGDIHLTVAQTAGLDGAVVVTTPQRLSVIDVEKGIQMFDKVFIPTISVVENMSYLPCGSCGEHVTPFGKGGGKAVAERFGVPHFAQLPIDPEISADPDGRGFPYISWAGDRPAGRSITSLAGDVVREVSSLRFNKLTHHLRKAKDGGRVAELVIRRASAGDDELAEEVLSCSFRALRLDCRSASMIDEWTGAKKFKEEDIRADVQPEEIASAGNYAVRVSWSDGHSSIFPFQQVEALMRGGASAAAA